MDTSPGLRNEQTAPQDGKEAKRNTGRSSSNSALLDQLAKSRAALVEREFQNDSEDDERVYART